MSFFGQGARSNNLIDVNHNDNLLSSSYRLSKDKQVIELQEQIKLYKQELSKKDELIAHLSTVTPRSEKTDLMDTATAEATSSNDKNSKLYDVNSHAELAAAKIKIENMEAEIRELQAKLDVKQNNNEELRSNVQLLKENDARQSVLIQNLKEELQHSKHQSGALEQITAKGTLTIQTLQSESREAQEKILDLEAKLRSHIHTLEESTEESGLYKRKYHDAVVAMGEVLCVETEEGRKENVVDTLLSKARNLCQEQVLLQSRIQTLDDALNAHSLETKASRETIMRLVSEVGKEQKNISEVCNAMERVKQERSEVEQQRDSLAREIDLLKNRLVANDKTWASSREEMTQTATKANMLTEDVKRLEHEKNGLKFELKSLCESLSKILSNSFVEVAPNVDAIKDRIQEMMIEDRDKRSHVDQLEAKIRDLSTEMEQQRGVSQDSVRRIKSVESTSLQKEHRVHALEDELASADVVRDTLRRDKAKYLAFLQQMAEAMKMEEIAVDLGYDFNTDVLIARAHQLAKLESDALVEKTSSNYNLQRKLKSMKEDVRNKEMHMELMRKKISQLEERNKTRNNIALDRDDAIVTVQRLHRKVERLQHALGDERVKVGQLKAELAEIHQLKTVTLEQRRKIDELVNNVGKLSSTKERQRQKLTSLKRNLSASELSADERNSRLQAQLDAVTNDLKSTKISLDEVSRREKQLVDFREMVARVLGLDVSTLAIPDYEVISRLEKLIRNQHIGAAASAALDSSLSAMNYPFKAGYEGAAVRSPSPSRYHAPSPPQVARDMESAGPKRHYRRSRSPSPKRY